MLTTRTKRQLLAFVFLTLIGVSYVGARYAKLGTLFYSSTFTVHAHFVQSGGIFTGSEVDYRGVGIGQVTDMRLIPGGVDVVLSIDKSNKKIPADTIALVANKSAVGEQYVDLEPKVDNGPYLTDGSVIAPADTAIPVSTTDFLTNLDRLVTSVPQDQLRTVVSELGSAFKGTGQDLGQIIDTSNAFIKTANANFDVTTALIKDGNTVLATQADKGDAIKSFAKDLDLFTSTLANNDVNLRALIDNGSATANELRSFLEENKVDLGGLINNLVTTGQVIVKHLPGIRQLLVVYPYVVSGGFTVVAKNSEGYNARFGLVLTQLPVVCHAGYPAKDRRSPTDGSNKPMDVHARCTEPASKSNARGSQNAPRTGAAYRAAFGSPVASYDTSTGTTTWSDQAGNVVYDGGAERLYGTDSWKSLLLQPAL
ncbi:MAG: virulence factor Mce family protein [Marmoricola sp.]|nr:virulence factor Mce family protein [Marmoricola sp.]